MNILITEAQLELILKNILVEADDFDEGDNVNTADALSDDLDKLDKSVETESDEVNIKPSLIEISSIFPSRELHKYGGEISRKILKIAKKLGVPEPTIEISEPFRKKINFGDGVGIFDVREIKVKSEKAFKLSETANLVAIYDNYADGYVRIDNTVRIPDEYLKVSQICDLCKIKRARRKIYIIKDGDEFIRAGSECVDKFLGVNIEKLIRYFNFLSDLSDSLGEITLKGFGGRISDAIRMLNGDKIISAAYEVVNKDKKYTKKEYDDWSKQRTNYGEATADKMDSIVDNITINEDIVEQFKQYVDSLEPKNEFQEDLKNLVKVGQYRRQDMGMVGYAMFLFLKDESKKDKKEGEYLGTVGEKHYFPWLKIVDFKSGEGYYGFWKLWKMEDADGNIVTKFGEINPKFKIGGDMDSDFVDVGDIVSFVAQVKKQEEKYGDKQTEISTLSMYKKKK